MVRVENCVPAQPSTSSVLRHFLWEIFVKGLCDPRALCVGLRLCPFSQLLGKLIDFNETLYERH